MLHSHKPREDKALNNYAETLASLGLGHSRAYMRPFATELDKHWHTKRMISIAEELEGYLAVEAHCADYDADRAAQEYAEEIN